MHAIYPCRCACDTGYEDTVVNGTSVCTGFYDIRLYISNKNNIVYLNAW